MTRFSIPLALALYASLPLTVSAGDTAKPSPGKTPGTKALAPESWDQERQHKHYQALIAAAGHTLPDKNTGPIVLGLRGVDPKGSVQAEKSREIRSYTDTYLLLWTDDKGKLRAARFQGSTTPGQAATQYRGTPDADADGSKDIAHLRPGVYRYKSRKYKGLSAFGNGIRAPCYRDTNHDGHIDKAEKRASIKRGDTATGILFHRGFEDRPSSVGCQTMTPTVFDTFEVALAGARRFTYVLIDVRERLGGEAKP